MLPLMFLMLLMVPAAQCFTINNPLQNFQATHGGNVRFAGSVVTAQISVIDTITRFNTFVIGGADRGNLAFDCDTGSVMVITGVTGTTVQYTITAVGQVDSYVYYGNHLFEPVGTNTDAVVYDAVTGITTVTTTGNVAVTLTYTTPVGAGIVNYSKSAAIAYMSFYFFSLLGLGLVVANGYALINGLVDFKFTIIFMTSYVIGAIILGFMLSMNI